MMRKVALILLFFFPFPMLAQQENPEDPGTQNQKVTLNSFTAQFLISTDLDAVYLNVVGAGVRYTNRHTSVSLTIFPSLSFREDKSEENKPFVRPGFAIGPLFQYKRFMFGLPTFYQDDAWHFTAGMGVKIGK
jgi:hypothetical protein